MLSDAQVSHFHTFGFVVLPGYLGADELAGLRQEFTAVMEDAYRATPFDGSARHWLPLLTPKAPILSAMAEDPRFFGVAEQLLGEVLLLTADANRYVADTLWHHDGDDVSGVKFMIYFDALDADTGALRLIPGSNHRGFSARLGAHFDIVARDGTDVAGHACVTRPGDVIAFDYPTWHASFGGSDDRQMCTIEYYRCPDDDAGAAAIREHVATIATLTKKAFVRDGYPFYDDDWIADRTSATRSALIDRMADVGVFEAAQDESLSRIPGA